MSIESASIDQLFLLHEKIHGYRPTDLPRETALLLIASENKEPVACLSCQIATHQARSSEGKVQSEAFGMIGHYAASSKEAGMQLLEKALAYFREQKIQHIVGPMDGSTWGRYRFLLPPLAEEVKAPLFLGEPTNPLEYPLHFESVGFKLIELYESRLSSPLYQRADAANFQKRLHDRGLRFSSLDLTRYEEDLKTLFELSLDSFSHNPYYMPIPESLFLEKYRALKPLINPHLVILAHDAKDQLAGFVFAFPDRMQSDRVILKTIATTPGFRLLGLGIALTDLMHQKAHDLGYRELIHALMHQNNASLQLSRRYQTRPMRRYGLYGITL